MLTQEEKNVIIGLIEDEMQMDDWETAYPQQMRELLLSALEKLKR